MLIIMPQIRCNFVSQNIKVLINIYDAVLKNSLRANRTYVKAMLRDLRNSCVDQLTLNKTRLFAEIADLDSR